MIADQIKLKISPEEKEYFINVWSSIIDLRTLIKKLDDYETLRRMLKKSTTPKNNFNEKIPDKKKIVEMSKFEQKRAEFKNNWKGEVEDRDKIFGKRKDFAYYHRRKFDNFCVENLTISGTLAQNVKMKP